MDGMPSGRELLRDKWKSFRCSIDSTANQYQDRASGDGIAEELNI